MDCLKMLCVAVVVAVGVSGCVATGKISNTVLSSVGKRESVAVSYIYDEKNGNITYLGDYLRDRVEAVLAERGSIVKARKDLVALIDDAESTDHDAEETIWAHAGADIIIRGSYGLSDGGRGNEGSDVSVRLLLKAYRYGEAELIDSDELVVKVPKHRLTELMQVTGNVYQQEFRSVVGTDQRGAPKLQARLDKPAHCYRPGEEASLTVHTEPGVYLYLFNLSCDGNVVALYPNAFMADSPLTSSEFHFPPSRSSIRSLRMVQASEGEECRESFKLVASRQQLDFSFLPFPANSIYRGANGDDIMKITETLETVAGYRHQLLEYTIDERCPVH